MRVRRAPVDVALIDVAYIETPDEKTVITANEIAFSPRVFSSKRSFRYSGTDRAREP